MIDDEKTWEDLLTSSKQSRAEVIGAFTAALALLHALRQGAPATPGRPLATDLLFDLAKLQTDTVKGLAEISARQTKAVADTLKERQAKAKGARQPPAQVLVSPSIATGEPVDEPFAIRNEASVPRGYPLPDILHLERLDGAGGEGRAGVFVAVEFKDAAGGRLDAPADCARPFFVSVPPRSTRRVKLSIRWDGRLEPGRYRCVVPLEAEGAPSAELIVELQVRGA
jgi:hypothetical protein